MRVDTAASAEDAAAASSPTTCLTARTLVPGNSGELPAPQLVHLLLHTRTLADSGSEQMPPLEDVAAAGEHGLHNTTVAAVRVPAGAHRAVLAVQVQERIELLDAVPLSSCDSPSRAATPVRPSRAATPIRDK